MDISNRLKLLTKRIADEFKNLRLTLSSKVDNIQVLKGGFLKTNDTTGEVEVIEEDYLEVPTSGIQAGKVYGYKDNAWEEIPDAESLTWTNIQNKPVEFPPESHNHDDIYYTETEVDSLLQDVSIEGHTHDDRYYTETEIDSLLLGLEPVIPIKNSAFNKLFGTQSGEVAEGNHNHDDVYYSKTEVNTLISGVSNSAHDHNNLYYTKQQVDVLLGSNLSLTHNHDDRYYTETEIDNLLLDVALEGHTHDDRYYTKVQSDTALQGKSEVGHTHDDRYYTEIEMDTQLDVIRQDVSDISTSTSFTPAGGIPVILESGKTFGKFENGDTIPGGISLYEVIRQAVSEYLPAVFNLPESEITSSVDTTQKWEVGTTFNLELNVIYDPQDAGSATNYIIKKGGVSISNSPVGTQYIDSNFAVSIGDIDFQAEIDYEGGTGSKPNSLGQQEPNTITAGTEYTNIITLRGFMPIFYGSTPTVLTSGSDIRSQLDKVLDDLISEFTLQTGTVDRVFQFWIPQGRSLVSVIDLDAFNADITSTYLESPFQGEDAGGNLIPGTLYTCTNDIPYSTDHRHVITLNNI